MPATFDHGFALLIGVGACDYAKWSLPATVKDMSALRAALTDPHLCAYPADDQHFRLLHDDGATGPAILEGLDWLRQCTAADPDATAVVYYSGHGWVHSATGAYYLIPHDVAPYDIPGTALAASAFNAALRSVTAKRLLVFMDCCHAEGMATAKDSPTARLPPEFAEAALPKAIADELKQGAGRAVFSSSRGSQRSWVRPDGTLSIFTDHLLEALAGAASQPGPNRAAQVTWAVNPQPRDIKRDLWTIPTQNDKNNSRRHLLRAPSMRTPIA